MAYINQLPVITDVVSGDHIPVWSTSNGDSRRVSIGSLLSFFQEQFASPTVSTTVYVPSTGFNISVATPVSEQQWIVLQPAGTLAAGTLTLPINTSTPDGTEVLVTTTQAITSFTVGANGASAVYGDPTTLAAEAYFRLRFIEDTNSWYRIG